MEKIALIPGSFDPVTIGHMALIETAASLFDRVVVCILVNPDKTTYFDEETRMALLRAATAAYPNVVVEASHGMTADYATAIGADCIVRGVRTEADVAYELEMAEFNCKRSGIQTILLPAVHDLVGISSTAVRAKLNDKEDLSAWMPKEAIAYLKSKHRIP